jgi:hypothetical protein
MGCGSREGYCSERVKGKSEKLMEKKNRKRDNFGVRAIEEIGAETKEELRRRKFESQCLKRIEIQNGILIHRLGLGGVRWLLTARGAGHVRQSLASETFSGVEYMRRTRGDPRFLVGVTVAKKILSATLQNFSARLPLAFAAYIGAKL